MREIHARAYVELLLREFCGVLDARRGPDGDYPVDAGGSCVYVNVSGDGLPRVRFQTVALQDASESPELLAALNEFNSRLSHAKLTLIGDEVLVSADLLATIADAPSFMFMMRGVVRAAQASALSLVEVSGGQIVIGTAVDYEADEWNVLLEF